MAEEQKSTRELQDVSETNTSLKFEKLSNFDTNKFLMCDVSLRTCRPFVPEKLRREVFNSIHNLYHPGIKDSLKKISKKFVWLSMNKDVRNWAKSCLSCQKSKVTRHVNCKWTKSNCKLRSCQQQIC